MDVLQLTRSPHLWRCPIAPGVGSWIIRCILMVQVQSTTRASLHRRRSVSHTEVIAKLVVLRRRDSSEGGYSTDRISPVLNQRYVCQLACRLQPWDSCKYSELARNILSLHLYKLQCRNPSLTRTKKLRESNGSHGCAVSVMYSRKRIGWGVGKSRCVATRWDSERVWQIAEQPVPVANVSQMLQFEGLLDLISEVAGMKRLDYDQRFVKWIH